ncbi:CLUMA_CG013310, isoform A [Clunio marinus]|uniref:CLUMA_CG013310, isoform A n=1 Tax=Clunio marinus TaxID=568069 RepID=A0A1J1ILS0_9DIPT|nr:CLUMA_CG013310, isoform A [Clunio marinus]
MYKASFVAIKCFIFFALFLFIITIGKSTNALVDSSVKGYQAERTCGYNEICKEEFRKIFRCRCPTYLHCRSSGKYYNAFCSITENSGYIWLQKPYELQRTP